MASSYVNDLRLNEMATGDASGTWGDTTNINLELIGEALGFGTEGITTNADTHTSTVADGATDPVRAMYVKYTGTLDSACTITIAPNTINRMQFIENGTSGSQNIIISQGSGANITIPPGDTKAVYLDGAGSGAAVVDAFASLNVVDLKVQDDLTVTDDATIGGTLGVTGIVTLTDDLIIGDGKTIGSASDVDAITIAANGQLTLTQTLIGTALDISGDIDVDGTANLDVVDIDGAVDMASTLAVAGLTTLSGDLTLASATANKPVLTLTDTNADSQGPDLVFRKDSASPADGDELFRIYGYGDDSGGTETEYFLALATMTDVTDGTEDSKIRLMTYGAGSQCDSLSLAGKLVGIGVETPVDAQGFGTALHIEGAANSVMYLRDAGNDNYGYLGFEGGSTNRTTLTSFGTGFIQFATNNTERARITADGSLVISDTTAIANTTFDARDVDNVTSLNVQNNGAVIQRAQAGTQAPTLNFFKSRGTLASPANVNNGDFLGAIAFRGYHTNGFYNAATIEVKQDGANGVNDMPGTIIFNTSADGSATVGERMRISTSGQIMFGASSSLAASVLFGFNKSADAFLRTQNNSTGATNPFAIFHANGTGVIGSINCTNSATVYNTSSDYRLKENVRPIENGLDRLNNLNPVKFEWKEDGTTSEGFIAHEAQAVFPDAITGEKDGEDIQGMDYGRITPLLVKAIQEQQEQIEQLKTEIEKLH